MDSEKTYDPTHLVNALQKVEELKANLRTERAEKERKQKEKAEREAREREIAEREELNCHMEQYAPDEAFMMEFYKGRHSAVRCSDGIGSGAVFTFSVPGHRAIVGVKQNVGKDSGIRWYYLLPNSGTWVAGTLANVLDKSEMKPGATGNEKPKS